MKTPDGYAAYLEAFAEGLRPDPPLWIDEFSEQHMIIPASTGASEPGRYRLARTPYAREVMRALSPEHSCRRVVVKGASQLLKTQVGLNWFCGLIAGAPANAIWLQPTDKLAKRVSSRFDKTVEAVDIIRDRVAKKRSRDNHNTIDTKEFKGGTLWILTGRSASNLSEAAARYVYADEVDRILRELKGEGDPITLLEKRQSTYGRKAKSYYTSSPTEKDASRIDELFEQGNQQHCYVPCPHCEEMQVLEWERLQWDFSKARAWYVCINGCEIEETSKPEMLSKYEWRDHSPGDGETESFTISYLYAPLGWDSWIKMAMEYEQALTEQKSGSSEKMQVFWNTRLARCWTNVAARIGPEELKARAENYPLGRVPRACAILTASVDVQINRLEVQIVAWGSDGSGLECWIVGVHKIFGDPSMEDIWGDLDRILMTPLAHENGGSLVIRAVCVDSGDKAQDVYEFVRPRKRRFVFGHRQDILAIKGASQSKKPIIAGRPASVEYNYRGRAVHAGAEVWQIGTDTAKEWIHDRLSRSEKIAIHTSDELPIDFYEQLLAEAKVTKWVKRKKRTVWEMVKRGIRNEQSDLMVYNLAAAHYLGLPAYTRDRWDMIMDSIVEIDTREPSPAPGQKKAVATKRAATKRPGGVNFSDDWAL